MDVMSIFNALLAMLNEMSPYILLGFLFAGILHAFVRPEVMTRHLAGNGFKQAFKAALIGVPLPLCSCGVLPTAISLRRGGASLSSTTSFLIATPQTGVDSIAATYSLLGTGFAILRPVAALFTAIFGGTFIGHFGDTRSDLDPDIKAECLLIEKEPSKGLREKIIDTFRYGFIDMVESVGKWLVIGLIIAALITVLVPDDLFVRFSHYPIIAMLAVVIIAVPMYICATGSIPIALSLMLKGLTPGVAFVLLMAGPAVNFASYTLLSRAIGKRNTLLYIGVIAVSAILIGVIVDYLLPAVWFLPTTTVVDTCCAHHVSAFDTICSVILVALLVYALLIKKLTHKTITNTTMSTQYIIKGMSCPHCKNRVETGLAKLPGVTSVNVDLNRGIAIVEGTASESDIAEKVNAIGYTYAGKL